MILRVGFARLYDSGSDGEADLGSHVRAALDGGATSLLVHGAPDGQRGPNTGETGFPQQALDVFIEALVSHRERTGMLAGVALNIQDEPPLGLAERLVRTVERRGLAAADLHGEWGFDPLGTSVGVANSLQKREQAGALVEWAAQATPHMQGITLTGRTFAQAGASDVEELGLVFAAMIEYLRLADQRGLDFQGTLSQIAVRLEAGRHVPLQIAKFRAARLLFRRIVDACGGEPLWPRIHAETASRTRSALDAWTNLIRGTMEATAAIIGGATTVAIDPFDRLEDNLLGDRLALNTLHILLQEAKLAEVQDPAGGSYCLESLTEEVAEAAWALLQQIEAHGGLTCFAGSGDLSTMLRASAKHRERLIRTRRHVLIGASRYAPSPAAIERNGDAQDLQCVEHADLLGAEWRDSGHFEVLRRTVRKVASDRDASLAALIYVDASVGGGDPAFSLARDTMHVLGLHAQIADDHNMDGAIAQKMLFGVICGVPRDRFHEARKIMEGRVSTILCVGEPELASPEGVHGMLYRHVDLITLVETAFAASGAT